MNELPSPQRKAAYNALKLLHNANLPLETLIALQATLPNDQDLEAELNTPSIAVQKALYRPERVQYLTPTLQLESGWVTRKHVAAAVLEYL